MLCFCLQGVMNASWIGMIYQIFILLVLYSLGFATNVRSITLIIDICSAFGLTVSAMQIGLQYFMRMAVYTGGENLIYKFAMLGLYKTHKSENTNLLIGLS